MKTTLERLAKKSLDKDTQIKLSKWADYQPNEEIEKESIWILYQSSGRKESDKDSNRYEDSADDA